MVLYIRILRRLKSECFKKVLFPIKNLFIEFFSKNYILVNSSVNPISDNWGDCASEWLVKFINPHVVPIQYRYSWNLFHKDNYMCIGSIISWMTTRKSIIWGTGLVYPEKTISSPPKNVLAVRGPLTRAYLLKYNISCPEIYGDPAMLFPMFYHPPKEKKYQFGIIPHFRDKNAPLLRKLASRDDVLIIDVEDINPWNKFIDSIYSCEYIFSSSLHGIIISDAYGVPNSWVEFPNGEKKRFAFQDYYASISRPNVEPLQMADNISLEFFKKQSNWVKPNINLDQLLECCPFKQKK